MTLLTLFTSIRSARSRRDKSPRRQGVTITETIVACTLLASLMAVFVPTVVSNQRIQRGMWRRQIAHDELANQLERLQSLPFDQLPAAVDALALSARAIESLPDAQLTGEISEQEEGLRLTVQLDWNSPGQRTRPIRLVTWVYPHTEVSE